MWWSIMGEFLKDGLVKSAQPWRKIRQTMSARENEGGINQRSLSNFLCSPLWNSNSDRIDLQKHVWERQTEHGGICILNSSHICCHPIAMCNCQMLYLSVALLPTDSPGPCGILHSGFFFSPPISACGRCGVITTLLALPVQYKHISLWLRGPRSSPHWRRASLCRKWQRKALERCLSSSKSCHNCCQNSTGFLCSIF